MVSIVDGEHPRSHKVHNAEPNVQDQGRKGLAEVRDLTETEESSRHHPSPVQGRLEVQRDESQTNVSCPVYLVYMYMYMSCLLVWYMYITPLYLHIYIYMSCLIVWLCLSALTT